MTDALINIWQKTNSFDPKRVIHSPLWDCPPDRSAVNETGGHFKRTFILRCGNPAWTGATPACFFSKHRPRKNTFRLCVHVPNAHEWEMNTPLAKDAPAHFVGNETFCCVFQTWAQIGICHPGQQAPQNRVGEGADIQDPEVGGRCQGLRGRGGCRCCCGCGW